MSLEFLLLCSLLETGKCVTETSITIFSPCYWNQLLHKHLCPFVPSASLFVHHHDKSYPSSCGQFVMFLPRSKSSLFSVTSIQVKNGITVKWGWNVCLEKFVSKNATDTCMFVNIFAGDCFIPLWYVFFQIWNLRQYEVYVESAGRDVVRKRYLPLLNFAPIWVYIM